MFTSLTLMNIVYFFQIPLTLRNVTQGNIVKQKVWPYPQATVAQATTAFYKVNYGPVRTDRFRGFASTNQPYSSKWG